MLSNNGLCAVYLLLIFAFATLLVALPRTLGQLGWLSCFSVALIAICGLVAMIGAGVNPLPSRIVQAAVPNSSFLLAFLAVTSPVRFRVAFRLHETCLRSLKVFSYAGHFM